MSFIAIHLPRGEVRIGAERERIFRYITEFDSPPAKGGASSRVLSREENILIVEFKTPIPGIFGKQKIYRTVEKSRFMSRSV